MLITLFVFLARAFKGLGDTLRSHWDSSVFKNISKDNWFYKWAAGGSWVNKWKLDKDGKIIPNTKKLWYYLWLYAPKYEERFLYSSTFLVKFTDLWHTSENYRRLFWLLAIIFAYLHGTIYQIGCTTIPLLFGWLSIGLLFNTVLSLIFILTIVSLIGFTLMWDYLLDYDRWTSIKNFFKNLFKKND